MEEPDELTVQQSGPASQSFLQQLRPWLVKHWDLLALLLLVLASFPVEWLSPRMLVVVDPTIEIVGDSWHLDTSFKAARGLWFGRDVAFTYGPVFQWLSSAPARQMGVSMGATYATFTTLPLWCTFLFGSLTLTLLLPEQPAWKRFVLLLLLCVFWAPWEGRTAFGILLFAVFLRGWYALRQQALGPVLLGCGAAFLCAVAFLYSADTGAYAIAALLLSLAGVAWESRRESRALLSYASALPAFAVASLVLVIAINGIMARPLDFRFWKNSLAILSHYRWIEPRSMSEAATVRLLVALLAAGVVFLVRGMTARNRSLSITARCGFLLSAGVFAFFNMQSGLVRGDREHIVVSTYAAVFLTGVVLFSFASRTSSVLTVLFAVACFFFSGPDSLVPWVARVHHNYLQLRRPLTQCPPGFREFDRACYPEGWTRMLGRVAGYVQERSGPNDYMAVFPYQTFFGIASRRSSAGGVMQSYLVSGEYLSQIDIAGLERAAAPAGLYLPDGKFSGAVDDVSSFTRSPEVWLWMFRHYRSEREVYRGIFGLQKDDSRAARIAMQFRPLNIASRSYPIRTRTSEVDLGDPAWPGDRADFLRLRLTVHYSPWWKLRKPALLILEIEHPDSTFDQKLFLVEPNVASEVWFYPGDEAELAKYFDPDANRWHSGPRAEITHLRLLVMPFDWVSVQPEAIEVQGADAVSFEMSP
jgi:hypothetical protein